MIELGRRAVACKAWRWLPGVLTDHGRVCGDGRHLVVHDIDEAGPWVDCSDAVDDWPECLPDLTDPATLGCLLALVREAWNSPTITVYGESDGGWRLACNGLDDGPEWAGTASDTEAEAMVAALEAAP